jgi:GGDEF domain-containing protein
MNAFNAHRTETAEKPAEIGDVLASLRAVHEQKYTRPDALRCTERIVASLGATNRELLQVFGENMQLRSAIEGRDPPTPETVSAAIRERAIRLLYHHFGYSTQDKPIKTLQFGQLLTKQHLEEIVRESSDPKDALRTLGLVMVDVDGLKGVKECIGHYDTNRFVQYLSQNLTNTQGQAKQWAEQERGIAVTPLVAGGDEFALLLKSKTPLDDGTLEEIIDRYEADVMADPQLQNMVNFNSPTVLLNYAGFNHTDRQEFFALPAAEQAAQLTELRKALPTKFTPSVSCGAATLEEGMRWALEQQDHFRLTTEEQDFEEAGAKVFQGMFHLAEDRETIRKANYKLSIKETNPALHRFITRTGEMVKMEDRIAEARAMIADLLPRLSEIGVRMEEWANGDSPEGRKSEQVRR